MRFDASVGTFDVNLDSSDTGRFVVFVLLIEAATGFGGAPLAATAGLAATAAEADPADPDEEPEPDRGPPGPPGPETFPNNPPGSLRSRLGRVSLDITGEGSGESSASSERPKESESAPGGIMKSSSRRGQGCKHRILRNMDEFAIIGQHDLANDDV